MNVARHPCFLLREPRELEQRSSRLLWDERRRALTLAQNQELRLPASAPEVALGAWETAAPLVLDSYGQLCRIDATGRALEYHAGRGYQPLADGELRPVEAIAGQFTDLTLGTGGRLAAGYSDADTDHYGVLVFDLTRRWQAAAQLPAAPIRIWLDCDNRVWCLTAQSLILCGGEPLPHPYAAQSTRFEPDPLNPSPLRILAQWSLPAGDHPLALCSDQEQVYLLVHNWAGEQTLLAKLRSQATADFSRYPLPAEVPFALDLAMASPGRLALLAPRQAGDPDFIRRDCPVVQLPPEQGPALLVRERYPMLSQAGLRFVASADGALRYQAEAEHEDPELNIHPRELHPLRRPHYYAAGVATLTQVLDSGEPDTLWHRMYLEGCIPPRCKLVVHVKAYNSPLERTSTPFEQQPEWVWCPQPTEQPFGHGLVEPKRDERGLFELLLQRESGPVRRLSGRYLLLRIQMESDGHRTPAIHALKIYYPRYSYQESYLPEHFHQEQAVDPSQNHLPANGADVRERFLAAFEGVWTPLENQIANADILLSPDYTPSPHLPWLTELMGQSAPAHWPEHRRRRWLSATGPLQRWRGTLAGIQLALDIVTDGALAKGQVVLVENFRLRRTMATILGLNMDDREHPLTLGTGMSGNSLVGDSLILSEGSAREFLSLFAPELADDAEQQVVTDFFERNANQVTVLLHGAGRRLRDTVEETLTEQMPAHLQWRVLESDHPFVPGLAPLLGVDTFLELQPAHYRVTLNDTYLGREGLLRNPAAFSPRDINARGAQP